MLKDPKPPMIPKETSLTTHPEASTKMYGINKKTDWCLKNISLVEGSECFYSIACIFDVAL